MNKQTALKIVNPLLGLFTLIQVITGIFHSLIPYDVFIPLHTVTGYLMAIFAGIHIYLNWNWIKANMFKKKAA